MNKLLFAAILVFFASVGFSQDFYSGTDQDITFAKSVDTDYIAEFALDVFLDSGELTYSRPYDVAKVPIAYHDTGNGSDLVPVLGMGRAFYSCYDNTDETGTDSVKVWILTQISDYAADGNNPLSTKSDAWTTLHTDSVIAASAAKAIVETERAIIVADESTRFIRWKITNVSTSLIDEPRCRIYWTRKKFSL